MSILITTLNVFTKSNLCTTAYCTNSVSGEKEVKVDKPIKPTTSIRMDEFMTSLLTRVEEIKIDNLGGEYYSNVDDFRLIIPKGAVQSPVMIQVGVVAYGPCGPFEYPKGCRPVSPIIWVCTNQETKFLKSIKIILPHCIDCTSEEDCKTLTFLKADHTTKARSSGEKVLCFQEIDGESTFTPQSPYGTLLTKHFCMYCVGEFSREDTDRAKLCLTRAKPRNLQEDHFQVHFCLTYFLPTCLKVS